MRDVATTNRSVRLAAKIITAAGLGMALSEIVLMWSLPSGRLSWGEVAIDSLDGMVGVVNATLGIAILSRRTWARVALLWWTFISAALFTTGTVAGKLFFDWQVLSYVFRSCLVLYYAFAVFVLWKARQGSLAASLNS